MIGVTFYNQFGIISMVYFHLSSTTCLVTLLFFDTTFSIDVYSVINAWFCLVATSITDPGECTPLCVLYGDQCCYTGYG